MANPRTAIGVAGVMFAFFVVAVFLVVRVALSAGVATIAVLTASAASMVVVLFKMDSPYFRWPAHPQACAATCYHSVTGRAA